MASNHHLHPAVVLLSLFAAAAATGGFCSTGFGLPENPLMGCRAYVAQQTCGIMPHAPISQMKERCCRELADLQEPCRCAGLREFIGGPLAADGGIIEMFGCPREAQRDFAKTLVTPGQCNLRTVTGGTYCLFAGFGM